MLTRKCPVPEDWTTEDSRWTSDGCWGNNAQGGLGKTWDLIVENKKNRAKTGNKGIGKMTAKLETVTRPRKRSSGSRPMVQQPLGSHGIRTEVYNNNPTKDARV